MWFMGVDPGLSGGIAILDAGGRCVSTHSMPDTDRDLVDLCEFIAHAGHSTRACVERVGAFPGMGCVSAFTFGRGYGALQVALTAARIPFELVTPPKWQTVMGCRTKGDKNISKARAQALFPAVKVTHAIADCLLIAEFCRRTTAGPGPDGQPIPF